MDGTQVFFEAFLGDDLLARSVPVDAREGTGLDEGCMVWEWRGVDGVGAPTSGTAIEINADQGNDVTAKLSFAFFAYDPVSACHAPLGGMDDVAFGAIALGDLGSLADSAWPVKNSTLMRLARPSPLDLAGQPHQCLTRTTDLVRGECTLVTG